MEAGLSLFRESDRVGIDITAAPDFAGPVPMNGSQRTSEAAASAPHSADANSHADANSSAEADFSDRFGALDGLTNDELVRHLLRITRKRAAVDADLLL